MMNDELKTNSREIKTNALLLCGAMIITFALLRAWLHLWPDTDLNVGGYNIHHLFTGLLLIAIGGIPLAIFGTGRKLWPARLIFGAGLGMALDEWVYLIATDGTNASYLLPISLWGAVVVIGLACVYAVALALWQRAKTERDRSVFPCRNSPASGKGMGARE